MNYEIIKQEIDNGKTVILDKNDCFALIKILNPSISIPWIYNFAKTFKFYKLDGEYIVEPNNKKGGI